MKHATLQEFRIMVAGVEGSNLMARGAVISDLLIDSKYKEARWHMFQDTCKTLFNYIEEHGWGDYVVEVCE